MPPRNNSQGSSVVPHAVSHLNRSAAIGAALSRLNRRRKSGGPPPVMTWGKAIPIIIVAFTFDLVRIFFEWFWFFGPALAALMCTAGVNSVIGASIAGMVGKTTAFLCSAGAAVAGAYASGITISFGTVMADAVALIGWLTIGLWVFTTNQRMLKENGEDAMHVVLLYLSILISFIPILGTAPTVGMITYRFYKFQIKIEKAALKRYEEDRAAEQSQERDWKIAHLMQYRIDQDAQSEEQEASNDAAYEQEQATAANDAAYDESLENVPGATTGAANDSTYGEAPSNIVPLRPKKPQETNIHQKYQKAA